MDVILLERVANLGALGEVVSVKPGYARNYLLPMKKALRATKENSAYFERQKEAIEKTNAEKRKEATAEGSKMDGISVVIVRQAAESGQLYGSVTARDVADAVQAAGHTVSRQHVVIGDPIKTLGLFKITLNLHAEVAVTITVNVARSEEEAKTQAARGEALVGRQDDEDEDQVPETEQTSEVESA